MALSKCSDIAHAKKKEKETELTNQPLNPFEGNTEHEVIRLAKTDPSALSYLYRQNYEAIYCYVLRRIGNVHDTNDIVAEVFMSMVRNLHKFKWTGAPFRCWLLVLATNQINRWIRQRRFYSLWRSIDSTELQLAKAVNKQDARIDAMRQALLKLPLSFQTVLTLHYFEDLPLETIANMLHCRVGTVKSRLSRGREMLRQKLPDNQEYSDEQRKIGNAVKRVEV